MKAQAMKQTNGKFVRENFRCNIDFSIILEDKASVLEFIYVRLLFKMEKEIGKWSVGGL